MNSFIMFWFIISISLLIHFHFKKKLIARLKQKHYELYKKLGEPTHLTKHPISTKLIVFGSAPASFIEYTEFMASNGWESLDDVVLKDIGRKMLYTQYFGFFVLILLFSSSVYNNYLLM